MSTIVNARDVLLQATSPRLLPALLPGNITVETSSVSGLVDLYESARQVVLRSTSQIFQHNKIGSVTPSSIIITADLKNVLGSVTWTVVSGTVEYTVGTNTITILNSGLSSDVATIKASLTYNSITYSDVITIVKVEDGTDTITGFLTNESTMVSALSDGTVLGYGGTSGAFRVFQGIEDKTGTAVTYSVVSSTSVSMTISTTGDYAITNLTSDTGSVTIRATYGGVSIDKIYTVAKSKAGSNGSNGSRGTINIARSIEASIWSDYQASLALSTNGYSVAQIRDIVTLYNTSTNYSESKFYNGSVWLSLDAYINGNMLVNGTVVADKIAANSITADKIAAGSVTANKIDSRGLSIKDSNGNIILAAGNALDYSYVGGTNRPANNATVGASFGVNISGQINSSNITTYIANASIGKAQIGGDVYSSNWVYGQSGWYLDRNGNFYANNGEFRGDMTAGRISVGPSTSSTKFFDPSNLSLSLNSSAAGVFTYDGMVGQAVATSDDLLFKNNYGDQPLTRRLRTGDVFFSVICTGVVDDQMSLWRRTNGGTWVWLSGVQERQGGDGTAATGWGGTISVGQGDVIQFGVSPTNSSYSAADLGKLYLKQTQATVIARNF